jgi:hypothetical protein
MKTHGTDIVVSKKELVALLAFTTKDQESLCSFVDFESDGTEILAYATDSFAAVKAQGESGGLVGAWTVTRSFLAWTAKNIDKHELARIVTNGASISSVTLAHTETGAERGLEWRCDAVEHQTLIPDESAWKAKMRIPVSGKVVVATSLPPSCWSQLAAVSAAANNTPITVWMPKPDENRVICTAKSVNDTAWTVAVHSQAQEA